jgi:hypothetical protein
MGRIYVLLRKMCSESSLLDLRRFLAAYYPLDQTAYPYEAQAQIQLIVRKVNAATAQGS